jgi:hypothetical protein
VAHRAPSSAASEAPEALRRPETRAPEAAPRERRARRHVANPRRAQERRCLRRSSRAEIRARGSREMRGGSAPRLDARRPRIDRGALTTLRSRTDSTPASKTARWPRRDNRRGHFEATWSTAQDLRVSCTRARIRRNHRRWSRTPA